ncbi:MAG: hypothetical protein OXR72_08320 [Gemmatimonadota bacterium]|nr:hypothetical protein [Gemmatimonadota bacterium]
MKLPTGVDFDKLRVESEGFLGQAIALGVKYGRLSARTPDVLLAYLRTTGLRFGQRYRTGITVSRDVLEQGVGKALISLELGLTMISEQNLNRGVDLLAEGDFEKIRKRGWEEAFVRLEEMGRVCRSITGRPESRLLRDYASQIERWSRVVPETWMVAAGEDEDEDHVDPLKDYARFRELHARVSFIRLLPSSVLQPFAEAVNECGFCDFVRHLILALALDLDTLVPGSREISAFETDCLGPEGMAAWARDKVMTKAKGMARIAADDSHLRTLLMQDVEDETAFLAELPADSLSGAFVTES